MFAAGAARRSRSAAAEWRHLVATLGLAMSVGAAFRRRNRKGDSFGGHGLAKNKPPSRSPIDECLAGWLAS